MRDGHSQRWSIALTLPAMAALLSGCGDSLRWREEILLPDGRVVTAVRYQEFKGPSEPFKPPTSSDYRLEFRNPDTGEKVIWKYGRDLATVALSINDTIPELVTTPNYAGLRFRCPDPPYIAFRYIDGQWAQVELTDLARKVFEPNMTVDNVDYLRPSIEAQGRRWSARDVATHLPEKLRGKTIDLTGLDKQRFGNPRQCSEPDNWWFADDPAAGTTIASNFRYALTRLSASGRSRPYNVSYEQRHSKRCQ